MIVGPNVIESEKHCLKMAHSILSVTKRYDIQVIFKTSFDKAIRSSLNSYRGVGGYYARLYNSYDGTPMSELGLNAFPESQGEGFVNHELERYLEILQ